MAHKTPYKCPRCSYTTTQKGDMRKHLFSLQKPCPAIDNDIEVTEEVKEYILMNRIYRSEKQTTHVERTQTNNRKKTKITQAMRIVVWNTYIGEDIGKTQCLCCKSNSITQHNFHCGHVIAEANGGQVHATNLRPICAVCNSSMGTMDMKTFALNNFNVNI